MKRIHENLPYNEIVVGSDIKLLQYFFAFKSRVVIQIIDERFLETDPFWLT